MKAMVKFHNIRMIEDNRDGTVTIHYSHPLSVWKDMPVRKRGKFGQVHTITVAKKQLINNYV